MSLSVYLNVTHCVFWRNITHNLGGMAEKAGIYKALWRPEEIGAKIAGDIIEPLTNGLDLLKQNPDEFKKYNPENGWGDYEGLVDFVTEYLRFCVLFPDAEISVFR